MTITLNPIGIARNALSSLVADEVRKSIASLTKDLTPEVVQSLVEKDISLWRDCLPEGAKEQIIEAAHQNTDWMKFVNNGDLILFIYEARPDLEEILSTSQGKKWLMGLVYDIRGALGR